MIKPYTVIGFWEDTGQRYAEFTYAHNAEAAEDLVGFSNGYSLVIVCTIDGHVQPAGERKEII